MMTDAQKKMIAKMRGLGAGYTEVAKQLDLPVGTIKTYCRRNNLTGDRRDTQPKKKSKKPGINDLIDAEKRGNSTTAKRSRALEKPGFPDGQPVCDVTVSYADEPDKAALADVLTMLTMTRTQW